MNQGSAGITLSRVPSLPSVGSALREVVSHLVEQPLLGGGVIHGERLAQLLHQLALLAREARRGADVDVDHQVPSRATVEGGHAFVAQAELGAALRAFWD